MFTIIGDFHIPLRAKKIPGWILERIDDFIIATGDFTRKHVLDELKQYGKVVAVRGNMDEFELPPVQQLEIEGKRVVVVHGHQVYPRGDYDQLHEIAREFKADVLIHGHTHKYDVKYYRGILMLNPGTATGAWGGSYEGGTQSFIRVDPWKKVFIYVNGEEKCEYIA